MYSNKEGKEKRRMDLERRTVREHRRLAIVLVLAMVMTITLNVRIALAARTTTSACRNGGPSRCDRTCWSRGLRQQRLMLKASAKAAPWLPTTRLPDASRIAASSSL